MLLATLLVSAPSGAQTSSASDKETARRLLDDGDKLVETHNLAGALNAYRSADAIMHVPTTGIEVARTLAALGHLVEAREVALGVMRSPVTDGEPSAFTNARAQASKLASDVGARIPTLLIKVERPTDGASTSIAIDGIATQEATRSVPRALDPGKHVVNVSANGFANQTQEVVLAEGENRAVAFQLSPLPVAAPPAENPILAPPPTSNKTRATSPPAYGGFAVGAVGMGVGIIAGVMSLQKASDVKSHCNDNVCPSSLQSDADAATTLAWISNVGIGAGLVGIGVGTYFLVTKTPVTPALSVGPHSAELSVAGRF